jgi:two-component system sensor kinase FixL
LIEPRLPDTSHLDAQSALPLIQDLATLHDSVVLIEPKAGVFWLSPELARKIGQPDRLQGRCWHHLLAREEDADRLEDQLERTGRLHNEAVELAGLNGEALPATVSAARLGCDSARAPIVAILRLGEESCKRALGATLGTLTGVLDTAPNAAVIIDPSRFITYANPAIEQVTGYRPEELIDRPLALFVHDTENLERIAEALVPGVTVRNRDLEVRRRDGRSLAVSVSASTILTPGGEDVGAVAYLRDVTEQRSTLAELTRRNDDLEHYVHSISHDLRSPLVSLLGFTQLLREDYKDQLDPRGLHFLERVEQAGRTMESLIQDLLELSRIGRNQEPSGRVSARSVLLQLQAELKPRLEAAGVTLVLPVDPPILDFDQTRLYQLLSNLVGNALDHMGETDDPRIEVDVRCEDDHHLIVVQDNGQGIALEQQEKIFQIFHSLGPASDGRRGTGMGLAIVRKIAETRGGRAWVESEPGQGATFKVSILH